MRIQREKSFFLKGGGGGGVLTDVKEATETNKHYRGNNFVGNSPMPRGRLDRRLYHTQLFSNPTRMRKYPDRLHKITNTLDRNIARPVYWMGRCYQHWHRRNNPCIREKVGGEITNVLCNYCITYQNVYNIFRALQKLTDTSMIPFFLSFFSRQKCSCALFTLCVYTK